jgi:hypothetical protein
MSGTTIFRRGSVNVNRRSGGGIFHLQSLLLICPQPIQSPYLLVPYVHNYPNGAFRILPDSCYNSPEIRPRRLIGGEQAKTREFPKPTAPA